MTSPSIVAPGWCAVTNARNSAGALIGSPPARGRRRLELAASRSVDAFVGAAAFDFRERFVGASLDAADVPVRFRPAPALEGDVDGAAAGAVDVAACFLRPASRCARRLTAPRTGTRATKTQPTPGTGLPPKRRSSSNSHEYVPWNSWNESFERMVASVRFAICRTKASPRPTAPAGGVRISPASTASSNSSRSDWSMRLGNVASTTTTTLSNVWSFVNAMTASLSWASDGAVRPSVAMLDPSTTR